MNIKYTVVLTSYNAQETISMAINSFLTQSIIPLEIIVVDDASTDNTWSILQDLARNESCLLIFQNTTNRGQSFSRNLGVAKSQSKYIIFGDDDDKSLPYRADLHLQQLERGSDIGYVSSRKFYQNGYSTDAINSQISSLTIDPSILVRKLLLGENFPNGEIFVPSCALAVRKEAFVLVDGFDENFRRLEDIDLAIRFAVNGFLFDWSSEIALERHHSEGIDKGGSIDPFFEISLIDKYSEYLNCEELQSATIAAKLRSAYFSRRYIGMLKILLTHKGSFTLTRDRFFSFTRRMKHDFRKS
jgi:glycosyltransferase involved in cell wall biosynthesis